MKAVEEGHGINRRKTWNIDCDYSSTTGTEPKEGETLVFAAFLAGINKPYCLLKWTGQL